jgi:outer membrane protein
MRFSLVLFFLLASLYTVAQTSSTQKIGHADWEYIFSQMPEYKQIESELAIYEAQLQNQLKLKNQELESKYKTYTNLPASTPDAIRKDKESELTYLQQNLQKFQQDAQASMQRKQSDLINPVFAKVGKAIEEVAVENGFAYIINPQMLGGGDVLLYTNEKYNISELVLKKLGVTKVPPPTPADKN